MKGLSWNAREVRFIEVKRLRCPSTMPEKRRAAAIDSAVRFCICRYRRRARKEPHDRNDREARPRAR